MINRVVLVTVYHDGMAVHAHHWTRAVLAWASTASRVIFFASLFSVSHLIIYIGSATLSLGDGGGLTAYGSTTEESS